LRGERRGREAAAFRDLGATEIRASGFRSCARQLVCGLVTADVESARLEWEDAYRALAEAALDPAVEEGLRVQLEAVTSELRRRVGGTFTLRELADEYGRADIWARDALANGAATGWPRTLSLVEGAAFHRYSRGAVDYAP
jgi:hypothetical protein